MARCLANGKQKGCTEIEKLCHKVLFLEDQVEAARRRRAETAKSLAFLENKRNEATERGAPIYMVTGLDDCIRLREERLAEEDKVIKKLEGDKRVKQIEIVDIITKSKLSEKAENPK